VGQLLQWVLTEETSYKNVFWHPYDDISEVWTDSVLHGHQSCNSFVALYEHVLKHFFPEPVTRDFLGAISSLAPVSSNFLAVSAVCYLPGLSISDALVFSLSANLYKLCLVGSASEIFHQTCSCTEHVHCSTLYDSTRAVIPLNCRFEKCMT